MDSRGNWKQNESQTFCFSIAFLSLTLGLPKLLSQYIKTREIKTAGVNSAVKSTYCSGVGPRLDPQNTHGGSQLGEARRSLCLQMSTRVTMNVKHTGLPLQRKRYMICFLPEGWERMWLITWCPLHYLCG